MAGVGARRGLFGAMLTPLKFGAVGLSELETLDLTRLLSRLHDGTLECPIGPSQLHQAGLSYLVDRVGFLRGHDETTVRAVLVAVIAERRKQDSRVNRD